MRGAVLKGSCSLRSWALPASLGPTAAFGDMRSLAPFAFLTALVAPCAGWVTKSQGTFGAQISEIQDMMAGKPVDRVTQAQLGFLWNSPVLATDETGLGGGITWAWDPNLCELLMPRFMESIWFYDLVECADLKSAIARAFDKWAANSRFLKFIDVSWECEKLGKNYGPPTNTTLHPAADQNELNKAHGGCPLAKIWITRLPSSSSGRRLSDHISLIDEHGRNLLELDEHGRNLAELPIAEYEEALSAAVAVATAKSHARYTTNFRYTNGVTPFETQNGVSVARRVVETYASTFSFNVEDICWYLDSEFCSYFHYLKKHTGGHAQANLLVSGVTYAIMAIGILVYSIVAIRVLCALSGNVSEDQKEVDEDGDGKLSFCERAKAALRELASWNPFILAFFVTMIFCPPLLQSQIFAPCFNCHDFEATSLHEIGHILGLGHPDNIPQNMHTASWATKNGPGVNSYHTVLSANGRTNASNCGGSGSTATAPVGSSLWMNVKPFPKTAEEAKKIGQIDPNRAADLYPIKNAMMESETQHNPLACLTDDDLEALAVLYPDCGDYSLSVNVCHKVNLNLGFVRIAVYVLGPMLIGLGTTLLFVGLVHKYADDERKEDLKKTRRLSQMNEEMAARLQAQAQNKRSSKKVKKTPSETYDSVSNQSAI